MPLEFRGTYEADHLVEKNNVGAQWLITTMYFIKKEKNSFDRSTSSKRKKIFLEGAYWVVNQVKKNINVGFR